MKPGIVTKRIFFCVLIFWFFSLFSSFAMAVENISEVIQNFEQKRDQEKARAEFLGTKIDKGEYDEGIEEELTKIEENIQGYNLRISELREKQANEVRQVALVSQTHSPVPSDIPETYQEKGNWGWLVLAVIIGMGIFIKHLTDKEPPLPMLEIPNHRFMSDTPRVPVPRPIATPENIQRDINKGLSRLNDPKWLRSQANQNGEIPPELL